MDGMQRMGGYRRSRRSRSQRDRDRKMSVTGGRDPRPCSPSSGSDQGGAEGPGSSRPRPPRRKRRDSTSCEEDVIDGFAIVSFLTLEMLERETSQKPPERVEGQRKRPDKQEPEERRQNSADEGRRRGECSDQDGPRHNGSQGGRKGPPPKKVKTERRTQGSESPGGDNGSSYRSSSRGPPSDESLPSSLGTGYCCDIDSELEKSLCDDLVHHPKVEPPSAQIRSLPSVWKSNFFPGTDDGLSKLFTTATKIASNLKGPSTPGAETTVSGLERSRERSQDPTQEPGLCLSSPPQLPPRDLPTQTAVRGQVSSPRPSAQTQSRLQPSTQTQARLQTSTETQARLQSFAQSYGSPVTRGSRSSPSSKPVAPSQLPPRTSTPSSLSLALSTPPSGQGLGSTLLPPPHPHHPGLYTPSPGHPAPPPLTSALLQVSGHLSPTTAAAAFSEHELMRQELNSRYLSSQGPDRGSPLAAPSFQFHQHQHTHQHTHQHFAPYPAMAQAGLLPAVAPPLYFQAYHPAAPGLPSVLPPAGPFGSLQGAFQPKTPGADLAPRTGPVTHTLLRKDARISEGYRAALKKPGRWCTMHVRIAWMIYRHQEKSKAETQKLEVAKAELLSRGLGVFTSVTPGHELSRPVTLFTATGAVHPATSPYVPPAALSPFLSSSPHLDPYRRSPTFSSVTQLPNAAFGGLGSPAVASAIFTGKECVGATGYGVARDQWNRLPQSSPSFPSAPASWPRLTERERESPLGLDKDPQLQKNHILFLKEEERDAVYSRYRPGIKQGEEERSRSTRPEHRTAPRERGERPDPRGASRERPDPRGETRLGDVEVKEEAADIPRGTGAFHALPVIQGAGVAPVEALGLLDKGHLLAAPYQPCPWDAWHELGPLQHHYPAGPSREPARPQPEPLHPLYLREEREHGARVFAAGYLAGPPHHYPRLSPSLLLAKAPPVSAIGAPPPLVTSRETSPRARDPRVFPGPYGYNEPNSR
ncbi:autism susceptibility gene 2 protein homolog isoform X2 [Narcine bancroftii]|uniref:autism susceptibility gene 2 protein homolog isoform X2 n=1 Tax=Narcine bancroftii TaxID=1343680 RepID=UPI003831AD22